MRSTFMGLETARRGMFTQQSALYTTGHNISNANTPGYTRQSVNFTQTIPFPSIGMESPKLPGQMGTGVEAGSITRIRESFLDYQYRIENNKVGYFGTLSDSLGRIEDIMNEPSESGLHNVLEKFWNSLQDLSSHTENTGARDVVASTGQMVADTINYYYNSLDRVRQDIGNEIGVKQEEINMLITQIDSLNRRIAEVEPHGYLPNDLYDERDNLVDQLSGLVNIKVTNVKPNVYGNAKTIAEGLYNIELVQQDGRSYNPPVQLVSVNKASGIIGTNKIEVIPSSDFPDAVKEVKVGTATLSDMNFGGELGALIYSYGFETVDGSGNKVVDGYYPEMLENLNIMTEAFVNEFNLIHQQGYALGASTQSGMDFFEFADPNNPAQSITVNSQIKDDPTLIAAGLNGGDSADNKNAQRLADLKAKSFTDYDYYKQPGMTLPERLAGNLNTFYSGIIGRLGVDSQSAAKDAANSETLQASVDYNRQSVSSVSLDEEMTNLIKFQHAYNASARQITVIDEMLDKIINGMGTVGR